MDNPAFEHTIEDGERPSCSKHSTVSHRQNGNRREAETTEVPVKTSDNVLKLKQEVGLMSGIALIVGSMIGSGIFVSPSGILERTGSVGMSLVIWTACGLLSTLGAIAYIELGTVVNTSGAEYAYFLAAFGPIPAFLFAWVCMLILKPALVAVISLTFAEYTVAAVASTEERQDLAVKLVTIAVILSIAFINCWSVKLAAQVQNVTTIAKIIAMGIIIACGGYLLCIGNIEYIQTGFSGTTSSPGKIASAFYSGLWAYDGWNTLNFVTEEIKNPYRNLPRSIFIGLPLVTVLYVFVNISYLTVLSPSDMVASSAVAYDFGNKVLGKFAFLMPLTVAISTYGAANGSMFATGRVPYAASKEGHLMDVFSYIDVHRFTPSPGVIITTVVSILMILTGDIENLIDFFNFTAWIFYGGAMLAVIVLRYKRKDAFRPFKVPLPIPIVVLLISVYLIVGPIVDDPKVEYIYALIFIFSGLLVYFPFVHFKLKLPGIDKFTIAVQLLLRVAPPDEVEPSVVDATTVDNNNK